MFWLSKLHIIHRMFGASAVQHGVRAVLVSPVKFDDLYDLSNLKCRPYVQKGKLLGSFI